MKATQDEITAAVHVLWERNQDVSYVSIRDTLKSGFHRHARVEAIGTALASIRIGDKAMWLIQLNRHSSDGEGK